MPATLVDPDRANLLAIILHRMIAGAPSVPEGAWCVKAGGMAARLIGGLAPRVESGAGPADCEIRGSLDAFIGIALGRGIVGPWLAGRVGLSGNPFRALALLKVMRKR